MNIILHTNAQDPALELMSVQAEIGEFFSCVLSLRSAPFRADERFLFDADSLERAITALQNMNETLRGSARLDMPYEDAHIAFAGDGLGHVNVSGIVLGGIAQRLEWEFTTDQTCLSPLVRDLRKLFEIGVR